MPCRVNATLVAAVVITIAASDGAMAIVGPSQPPGAAARHTVMVLKQQTSGAAFCSGAMVARHIVLTAAHCVAGARGIAVYIPTGGAPKLYTARKVAIHPGYVANAIRNRKRSIDLALVQTIEALPVALVPVAFDDGPPPGEGARLTIAGFGLQREGVERSAGTLRTTPLIVRKPLSKILLWLRSPSRASNGACTGDSGGPVFTSDMARLVGVTVWSRGRGKRRCGELTQAVRVAPQRGWIESVARRWGTR